MALALTGQIVKHSSHWPSGTNFLQDQLKRAVTSILLNIAEGNGRSSKRDRKRFFNIAKASATETSAILDAAHALQWMGSAEYQHFSSQLLQVTKMVSQLS